MAGVSISGRAYLIALVTIVALHNTLVNLNVLSGNDVFCSSARVIHVDTSSLGVKGDNTIDETYDTLDALEIQFITVGL